MGGKTNEQLLEELSEVDFLPYPLAIFTPQYTLALTNKAFLAETKMQITYSEIESACILQHKINDMQLAAAIAGVFAGETFFLEDLKNPFSMFSGITTQGASVPDRFNRAVIFPVSADDVEITHGVIVFMP